MDLRTKLVFALVSVSLASMFLLGLLTYRPARDIWRESAVNGLDALAEAKQSEIERLVESWKDRVRLTRSRTQLRVLTARFNADHDEQVRPGLRRILTDARSAVPGLVIHEITVYDSHRDPIATTLAGGVGRAAPLDVTQETTVGDEVKVLGLTRLDIDLVEVGLSAPIISNEEMVGTMVVRMGAAELLEVVSDYHGLGMTGESMLAALDGSGGVQFLHRPRHGDITNLNLRIDNEDNPMVQALLQKEGTFSEDALDYRNVQVWAATRYLPDLGVGLVVKFDTVEEEAPLRELRSNTIRFGVSLSGLAILVAILVGVRFAAPILQLAEVVEKIEGGNYRVRAPVRTEDEIGRLAYLFNRMTDRLLESNRKLRQRIAEQESSAPPAAVGGPERSQDP